MLKLVRCELWKLKRRKFILLVVLSAFLFPIPLTYFMTTPAMMADYPNKFDCYDALFNFVLGYSVQFLLPCIVGVVAAILFFMERDNETFKNLCTIPITSTQMVLAKVIVLFLFSILFCIASTVITAICGYLILGVVSKVGFELLMSVALGVMITAGTLPLITLVVFFSKTYIFSVLLCIFYTVMNVYVTFLFDVLPKLVLWLMPGSLTTLWTAQTMIDHGVDLHLEPAMAAIVPSGLQVFLILGGMTVVSGVLIDRIYRRRRD